MEFPKIWDDPPIVVTVSRDAIASNDIQSTLDQLRPLVQDREQVLQNAGRLVLSFEGYGNDDGSKIWYDDPRKVCENPEIRAFVDMLAHEFPYWFYVADLKSDTLYILATCVCRIEVRGSETIVNKEDLLAFAVDQYDGMNQLYDEWKLPADEKPAREEQVARYFKKVAVQ